jgi:hypothetical protein
VAVITYAAVSAFFGVVPFFGVALDFVVAFLAAALVVGAPVFVLVTRPDLVLFMVVLGATTAGA